MKIRFTWLGWSVENHPVLGDLYPNRTVERDLPAELVAGLKADTSGLWRIEDVTPVVEATSVPMATATSTGDAFRITHTAAAADQRPTPDEEG